MTTLASEDLPAAASARAASATPGDVPVHRALLRFRDPQEGIYLQAEFLRSRRLVAIGYSIVAVIVASFFWIDAALAPAGMLRSLTLARSCVGLPCNVIVVVAALLTTRAQVWIPTCCALNVLFAWQVSALLLWNGAGAFQYLSYAIWQGVIVTFFLTGLPLRWSIATCAITCGTFALCALRVHVGAADFINYYAIDVVIVFALSALATYRYERASRSNFLAQRMSRQAHARQLSIAADRRHWLEVIAAFLRHELKNAMTGVSSSIELAARADSTAAAARYHERAQRSVHYMRRLLVQVADATSLESALKHEAFERFDLSELLRERVEDFRREHAERRFDGTIERDIHVAGSPDAVLQLVDKLLNNAIEHGAPSAPIDIALHRRGAGCTLVITDQGDALDDDVERLFQPFVTRKAPRHAGDSLGLGLFVARTIALHHGGSIRAEPLDSAPGARFTVELPSLPG